jgi:predicted DsbA family dithiol-disulfide isomerase/uncharacterized membrane protein
MTVRPSGESALGRRARLTGALLLLGTAAASAGLAVQHLGLGELPGCGLESACGRLADDAWGRLPGIEWPVAFLGLAHFTALLAAWGVGAARWPATLAWVGRIGALASLAFLGRMAAEHEACVYCVTAHVANLAFVLAVARQRAPRARRPEVAYFATFALVTAALAALERMGERRRARADEQALERSTEELRAGTTARRFTGRYRRGPEAAAVRLVLFTDYQCPDCARIEEEAEALLRERDDLSLSVKHFPLCTECNVRARELGRNPHRNACWAARAAEAAGMLQGDDAFWRVHDWLFARRGAFDERELRAALPGLGFEAGAFLSAMRGPETLRRVEADVAEALGLGIDSTPMVFVNGVELRGWRAPEGLRRAVQAAASAAPDAAPAGDRPQDALAKALEDWRLEPERALSAGREDSVSDGALDAVLWGDLLDETSRALERRLRALAAADSRLRVSFRHYPLDAQCGDALPDLHPGACLAARAVEAARQVGGNESALRLRVWLVERSERSDEATLRAAVAELGLDVQAWAAALEAPETRAIVEQDLSEARALGIHQVPQLFVAGKRVPRWRFGELPVLERILAEALEER